ncbi:small nuclear ribonucleoprotein g [Lynx pardinus]|uniref:Small nuclear ribonucleoprotein G n=1 Tax=Lynx pardinus TaxID=191816 RepID=A0A485MHW0_LYNPA|nr:small nuclear ribonucleoprotein g [Lynx pardinus]
MRYPFIPASFTAVQGFCYFKFHCFYCPILTNYIDCTYFCAYLCLNFFNHLYNFTPFCFFRFMDKKLSLKLNGGRHVQGILRGFDPFMNLVIDECVEMATSGQQNNIGMVVIRGNSIIMLEALERV